MAMVSLLVTVLSTAERSADAKNAAGVVLCAVNDRYGCTIQVFIFSQDFTVFGGSLSETHAQKICKV
jgi:acetyl-CoA carboxylase carboxyltransferase component